MGLADDPFFATAGAQPPTQCEDAVPLKELVHRATATAERIAIVLALKQARGNKAQAARLLQIDYKTIHSKFKLYGLATLSDINRERL